MGRLVACVLCSALLSVAWACGDDDAGGDAGPGVDSGGEDATTGDTGGEDAPGTDTGPMLDVGLDAPPPEGSSAFIAQGHLGRTMVSCDGGETWVANRSLDDAAICWPDSGPDLDCDHHPGAGKGISFGAGYFYATWGWGSPGGIDRSNDGVTWERVVEDTTYGGIAVGNDVVVAAARNAVRSTDGTSWEDTGETMLDVWNVRRAGFVNVMGGRFVMVADETNVAISDDDGATWFRPSTIDASCGQGVQTRGGIAAAGDTILILGGDGVACTSSDGGDTWSSRSIGTDSVGSQLVWTGSAFFAYGGGMAYTSPDGESWSSQATTPGGLNLGAIAYDPEAGVFVGVRGGWQQWYDNQVFYRSTDGVVWEEADSYVGQHPIRFIEHGYLESCPTE